MRGHRPILVLALILLTLALTNGHTDFAGYEIYTRASSRTVINSFKVFPTNTSWLAAQIKCHAEHAHLVVPDSVEEMNVLGLLFKTLPANAARHFHVGFTDQDEEGVWFSVLGTSQSPSGVPWGAKVSRSFRPNTAKNCALFREGKPKYDEEDCATFLSPYVCEKEIAGDYPDDNSL